MLLKSLKIRSILLISFLAIIILFFLVIMITETAHSENIQTSKQTTYCCNGYLPTCNDPTNNWIINEALEDVIRVHIMAHDDTPEEQTLKEAVRIDFLELITQYRQEDCRDCVLDRLTNELLLLEKEVKKIPGKYGSRHRAALSLEKKEFPLRHYGNMVFPPGEYYALVVSIGDGKGQNWWCLVYPSLCYPAAEAEDKDVEAGCTDLQEDKSNEKSVQPVDLLIDDKNHNSEDDELVEVMAYVKDENNIGDDIKDSLGDTEYSHTNGDMPSEDDEDDEESLEWRFWLWEVISSWFSG